VLTAKTVPPKSRESERKANLIVYQFGNTRKNLSKVRLVFITLCLKLPQNVVGSDNRWGMLELEPNEGTGREKFRWIRSEQFTIDCQIAKSSQSPIKQICPFSKYDRTELNDRLIVKPLLNVER
jgi:hypothetical protein